jgi:hypothetical protein
LARLIYNRDLRPSDVPVIDVTALEAPAGSQPAAWADVWRFALSFDPDAYSQATGAVLDAAACLHEARRRAAENTLAHMRVRELRSALWFGSHKHASSANSA